MNYGEIKAALAYYATSTATAPAQLLPVVEQRLYYGEVTAPALRISSMLKNDTAFALPDDWLEMHRVMSGRYRMDFMPYQAFGELEQYSGVPSVYSINDRTIALAPASVGSPIAYSYYAKFDPLVNDADENWLTINAPNVYLSSFLVEFARKSRDDALLARETQNYVSAISALMSSDKAAQISGTTLRRSPGFLAYR